MFALKTFSWPSGALFVFFAVGLVTGQVATLAAQSPDAAQTSPSSSSTSKRIVFDDFVDSVVRQERRLTDLMRSYKPIIETYIQEEGVQSRFQAGITPNGDEYFLSRLNLTGNLISTVPFADEEPWKRTEEFFVQDPAPFSQAAFAQALFPDLDHFERQNYAFEFVRWEILGDVRCAAVDVRPRGKSKNRGFVGRIWVEDQDHSIVRFTGAFTKGFAKRAFHFDSWRLNTLGNRWLPAYVYTEESNRPYINTDITTEESNAHDPPRRRLWFKAQTRVWGYYPKRPEGSHELSPAYTVGETTYPPAYPPEDTVVEWAQIAGLMAPDGEVNRILETVLNNLLVTNDLEIAGLRCRVLLTAPLESFVMGRTIVVSRGLLDVLPDEATLAAVLAHELAHIVLGHAVSAAYLTSIAWPFPDSQLFAALNFHFNRIEEENANKKALELFSKSPYKDQSVNVGRFLQALDASSARFPNLLHGRYSNDFGSIHLVGMQARIGSPKSPKKERLDQVSALPIGSRIVVDPWSDRIEMLKSKPVRLLSPSEKIPFEVTPFYPHLKRLDAPERAQNGARQ
jgi:hypothetical protein